MGSIGWDQNNDRQINTLPLVDTDSTATGSVRSPPGSCYRQAPMPNQYRIFPGFAAINQEENETNFNYNSLQAGVRVENRHGLTTQVAYTWSHNIDEVSNDLNGLSNPFNRQVRLRIRYRFRSPPHPESSATSTHSRSSQSSSNMAAREIHRRLVHLRHHLLCRSGLPLCIHYTGPGRAGPDGRLQPSQPGCEGELSQDSCCLVQHQFVMPIPWLHGTAAPTRASAMQARTAVVGPGIFNWNLALCSRPFRSPRMKEPRIELRFESFNTFNHFIPQGIDTNNHDGNFGRDHQRLRSANPATGREIPVLSV